MNGLGLFPCSSVHRWLGAEELDRALEHVARDHVPFLLDEALFWRAGTVRVARSPARGELECSPANGRAGC